MYHITFFAGTTGDMVPTGFTALTLFGGAEIRQPTLASLLLHQKRQGSRKPRRWDRWFGSDENLVITIFGGTTLIAPTAAEEYAALAGLLRSGALTREECEQLMNQLPEFSARRSMCRTFTVFGACVTQYPSSKKERRSLDAAKEAGSIRDNERRELESILDTPPEARGRLIGRLVMAHA